MIDKLDEPLDDVETEENHDLDKLATTDDVGIEFADHRLPCSDGSHSIEAYEALSQIEVSVAMSDPLDDVDEALHGEALLGQQVEAGSNPAVDSLDDHEEDE